MSMHDSSTRESSRRPVKWGVPITAVVIGVAYLVAGLIGHNRAFAFSGLGLMLAIGAAFLVLGRRSETVAGLMDRRDERINAIDSSASLFSGMVTVVAVIFLFVIEIARGEDGMPYAALGGLAGVAYVGALVWGRFRR